MTFLDFLDQNLFWILMSFIGIAITYLVIAVLHKLYSFLHWFVSVYPLVIDELDGPRGNRAD